MATGRRNCIAKRFWEAATPYIQIAGYLPVVGGIITAIYMLCDFVSTTQAYGNSIRDLETRMVQDHDRIISIQQEVHDIHGWISPALPRGRR